MVETSKGMTLRKQIARSIIISFVITGVVFGWTYTAEKLTRCTESDFLSNRCASTTMEPLEYGWPVSNGLLTTYGIVHVQDSLSNYPALVLAFLADWLFWSILAFLGMRVIGWVKHRKQ